MFKKLIIICVAVLLMAPAAYADHWSVDVSGVIQKSLDLATPANELATQVAIMYSASPGLWLGFQGCTTEGGDNVGGGYAELRLGTMHTTRAGTIYDLWAYGWWDVNDEAFDFENGSTGLMLSLTPVSSQWSLKLSGGADGYTNLIEKIVANTGDGNFGNSEHDDDISVIMVEEQEVAFQARITISRRF